MTINIEELTFECIIGLLDFERITPQKIIIDLKIDYSYKENIFINYAEVIALLEKEMTLNKYELLETALDELIKKLCLNFTLIERLELKIAKPDIISNAKVSLSKIFINK